MRIKNDVEFVKKECESNDTVEWCDIMERRCGEKVTDVKVLTDTKVKCTFSDGDWYYYTPACLEEDATLEKGKKYTIAAGGAPMMFVEESENFAIFEGGIVFKKEGNEFVEVVQDFMDREWRAVVDRDKECVDIMCGLFYIAVIRSDGIHMIGGVPDYLGIHLDDKNDAVNVVKY